MKFANSLLKTSILLFSIVFFANCKQYSQPKCGDESPVIDNASSIPGKLVFDSVYFKKYIIYYSNQDGSFCYVVSNSELPKLKSIIDDIHSNSCKVTFSGDVKTICPDSIVGWYSLKPQYLNVTNITMQ